MKLVLASDSFKGSLSNETINEIAEDVVREERIDCNLVPLLVADGGDGTLDALVKELKGQIRWAEVADPLFQPIQARWGSLGNGRAVVSMCESSGLVLVPEEARNPRKTTSFGCGELIRRALDSGATELLLTLGGSATDDGGIGALTALGYRFYKADGSVCRGVGEELGEIVRIDASGAADFSRVRVTILSDVTNPMTGEKGATRVFAPQKGADGEDIAFLEAGMKHFEALLSAFTGRDVSSVVGGGAAGGMGASFSALLGAEIHSGVETVLDLIGFDSIIRDADLVVTGEGRIDGQSIDGKLVSGVLRAAKKQKKPVIALVGSIGEGIDPLYSEGLTACFSIVDRPAPLEEIFARSEVLYREAFRNLLRTWGAK